MDNGLDLYHAHLHQCLKMALDLQAKTLHVGDGQLVQCGGVLLLYGVCDQGKSRDTQSQKTGKGHPEESKGFFVVFHGIILSEMLF